ncbi:LPS-assembly protein LptD [Aestuariivirga litoralis]|uniref:LPS-assembly protein LptD n=1 Tax=Aestuariivirga litoralis TaxID=2650924 RepID=UPI0018C70FD5|nr:LPS assembly protein LptD [Aestuariivirga litoralis]MBG1232027.1 LPS-assembly protein LptD [Aestuariivirga litoralis]
MCVVLAAGLILLAGFGIQTAHAIENKTFIAPITSSPPAGTRALVDADIFTYDVKRKIGTARGTVQVKYGPYTLTASRVTINEKTGEFSADGSIVITEPNGNVLEADTMVMRNKFRDGILNHIKMLLTNNGTILANRLRRVDGTTFIYERAHYTVCKTCRTKSGNPIWEIVSEQTTHDSKGHNLYHVQPRFKLGGVTVAGLPRLNMPDPSVTRRTGFLLPDLAFSNVYGVGAVVPFFWALSPSSDITFRPIFSSEQGPIADIEYRQALENGNFSIRGMGVHQFTAKTGEDDHEWRGAITTKGRFKSGDDWTYGWDGTLNSDRKFLDSYGFDGRSYATNDLFATRIDDQNYFSAQLLNFGSLDTAIDPRTLPYAMPFITGETIVRDTPIGGQFNFSYNAYSIHRAIGWTPVPVPGNPQYSTVQGTDQTRATTQMNWHKQFYGTAGTVVTPFANLRGDMITAENVPDPLAPGTTNSTTFARILPEVGVDARMPFVADLPFGQSIISPVFQIVSSANEGDTSKFGNEDSITLNYDHTSLFLADRFTGLDRYEGGTRADLGLTYSLFGRNGGFIRASLGQSFHIAGQNSFVDGSGLADNESDMVGAFVFQPWNELSLSYEARWKDDFSAINRQEAVASLSFDRISASLSYLDFKAEPAYGLVTEQHWVSGDAKVGLNDGWSLFGGMTYDIRTNVLTRKVAGVEFDCQCMNFKLYYAGTEDTISHAVDNRVIMSIEFATIGKTGFVAGF